MSKNMVHEPSLRAPFNAEDMARADAEYAALPGTPPDGWSFISKAELDERGEAASLERLRKWGDEMRWVRWTYACAANYPELPEGMWLEVWKERPFKEAAFDPPVTFESNRKDGSSQKDTPSRPANTVQSGEG